MWVVVTPPCLLALSLNSIWKSPSHLCANPHAADGCSCRQVPRHFTLAGHVPRLAALAVACPRHGFRGGRRAGEGRGQGARWAARRSCTAAAATRYLPASGPNSRLRSEAKRGSCRGCSCVLLVLLLLLLLPLPVRQWLQRVFNKSPPCWRRLATAVQWGGWPRVGRGQSASWDARHCCTAAAAARCHS